MRENEMKTEEKEYMKFGELDKVIRVSPPKKNIDVLEEGTYQCVYRGTIEKIKNGEQYLAHKWEEIDSGRWLYENTSIIISHDSKLGKILKACEIPILDNGEINLKELVGKQCFIRVEVSEYKGKKVNRITDHVPLPKQKTINSN